MATEPVSYLTYTEAVVEHIELMQRLGEHRYGVFDRTLVERRNSRPRSWGSSGSSHVMRKAHEREEQKDMSATLNSIVEQWRTLNPVERRQLREMLDRESQATEGTQRDRLIESIMGKYSDVRTSSDDFNRRKQDEIALENRRFMGEGER